MSGEKLTSDLPLAIVRAAMFSAVEVAFNTLSMGLTYPVQLQVSPGLALAAFLYARMGAAQPGDASWDRASDIEGTLSSLCPKFMKSVDVACASGLRGKLSLGALDTSEQFIQMLGLSDTGATDVALNIAAALGYAGQKLALSGGNSEQLQNLVTFCTDGFRDGYAGKDSNADTLIAALENANWSDLMNNQAALALITGEARAADGGSDAAKIDKIIADLGSDSARDKYLVDGAGFDAVADDGQLSTVLRLSNDDNGIIISAGDADPDQIADNGQLVTLRSTGDITESEFAGWLKLVSTGEDATLSCKDMEDGCTFNIDNKTIEHSGSSQEFDGFSKYVGTSSDDTFILSGTGQMIEGGNGFDTYKVLSTGGGTPYNPVCATILDSDRQGVVIFDGVKLHGGLDIGNGGQERGISIFEDYTFADEAGNVYGYDEKNARLWVNTVDNAGNVRGVSIENWHPGDMGITLRLRHWPQRDGQGDGNPPDNLGSPLVLDLDGDGIETTSLESASVYFDIDSDGIRERTAWVGPDDGLLALDRNGDGAINDANELFGTGVTYSGGGSGALTGPHGLETKYGSGFDKLGKLDSNSDGVIDAKDAAYADLKVWRDFNSDGQTDAGELVSLADSGVASISLQSTIVDETLNGNLLTDISTYTTPQGEHGTVGDVWFKFDQRDTQYDRPADQNPAITSLPNALGSGRVRDLRTVMAEDSVLKGMVEELASFGAGDLGKVSAQVEAIILRWCGVTDDSATELGRGAYANGAHIAVLEAWNDTPFEQWSGANPRTYAGAIMEDQWDVLARDIAARLIVQTPLGQALFPEIKLVADDFLSFTNRPTSADMLARLKANEPDGTLERLTYWHAGLRVLDCVYGSFHDVDEATYVANIETLLKAEGIDLGYYSLITARIGGDDNDGIVTQSVNGDFYYVGGGYVALGGAGDDEIRLGGDKQIVYYGQGQGNDLVHISPFTYNGWLMEPRVEIRLADLNAEDVSILRSTTDPADLVVTILASGEMLTLINAFSLEGQATGNICFADGVALSFADVTSMLRGGAGSDILVQASGVTELNGGMGDDILIGGAENTTYVFERGSGRDLIKDTGSDNVVRFGPGITSQDLIFFVDDSDFSTLYVRIADSDDVLRIDNQFAGQPNIVTRFEFADGGEAFVPTASFQDSLIKEYYVLRGSEAADNLEVTHHGDILLLGLGGDDILIGGTGNDTLLGGDGNDTLSGGEGYDTFVGSTGDDSINVGGDWFGTDTIFYARGDGNDRIARYSAGGDGNRLVLQHIDPDQVSLSLSANGQDVIVTVPDGSLTLQAQHYQKAWQAVGAIEFADGTIWDRLDILSHLFPEDGAAAAVTGTAGDDVLAGSAADEVIDGGAGDDSLSGKAGSDLYLFGIGSGNDTITEAGSDDTLNIDRVRLKGLDPADVEIRRFVTTGDMTIRILSTGETLTIKGQANSSQSAIEQILFEDGTVLTGMEIFSGSTLIGSDYGEAVYGAKVAETIDGGGGADGLYGEGGDDIYLWRAGAGSDVIYDQCDKGTRENSVLLEGLNQNDVSFARNSSGGLLVSITATGETLLIENQFTSNWWTDYGVDRLVFADGTVLKRNDLTELAEIVGTNGNDTLIGTTVAETIVGNRGDDTLIGSGGGDTYIWRAGEGNDTITPGDSGDVLRLHDVTRSDVAFVRDPNNAADLKIVVGPTGEMITVIDQYTADWQGAIGSIIFDDGTVVDRAQLIEMLPLTGTAGNDVIVGTAGNDVIIGGTGNDTLYGKGGGNVYVWGPGDGNDRIFPGSGGDILRLENVAQDGITLARESGKATALQITVTATGEKITVDTQFDPNSYGLTKIVFGDGSQISLDGLGSNLPYQGSVAAEYIYGDGIANILEGGASDDTLVGGQGGDTYLWRPGDGNDTIVEGVNTSSGTGYGYGSPGEGWDAPDTLRLSGVTRDDLTFARNDFNLLVHIGSTGETVSIASYYGGGTSQVERIVLDDGQPIDLMAIATSLGLAATAGDDTLVGGTTDDTLDGGAGNDILAGGLGDDSYVVGHTSDDETVYEDGGNADAICFADGIVPESVAFRRDGHDLIAEIGGVTRGAVTIRGQFSGDDASRVEEFRFGDGTVISWQAVEAYLLDQASTNGNDTIVGYAGNDVINARGGDDTIIGGAGDDIIVGGAGRDTVVFSGRRDEYTIEVADGRTVVTNTAYRGTDGTDILIGVENLQFATDYGSTTPVTVSLAANTAPVAGEATFAGREDHVLKLQAADLLAHASDPDGDSLRLVSVSSALGGTVTLKDGMVSFTPAADFAGEASFSYTVADSAGATTTAVAKVAVAAVNDAPVRATPLADTASAEDAPFSYTLPASAFTDVDGDTLVLSATLADGTALPSWLSFDPASATFSGTPPQDFNGSLSVRVSASDGSATAEQTFDIAITAVNDAPVVTGALADTSVRANDVLIQTLPVDLFTDVDGDLLSYAVTLSDGTPLPAWLSFDPDSRAFYGLPDGTDVGALTLRVTASDGSASASTEFTLTVEPGNTAPVVVTPLADVASAEDGAIAFTIPAGTFADVDGDALALTATLSDGSPLPAWLSFDANAGTFGGQPPANFNGVLTVKVTASDGEYTAASSFTLTVTPVNDAPVVAAPLANVASAEDTAISFTIPTGTFADVDGDALTLTATLSDGSPLPAWLAFDAGAGTFSGQPPADFNGTLAVTVTASDGEYTAASSFTLAVTAVNDVPVRAAPLTAATNEDAAPIAIGLLTGASDVDGDALSVANVQQTGGRSVAFTVANGTLTMAPGQLNDLAEGQSESLVFTYAITDGTVAVAQTVTVTVTGRNDRPVATDVAFTAMADHSAGFTLTSTDADAGTQLSYALVNAPAAGTVTVGADGAVSFDPQGQFRSLAEGESADIAFTWTATDEHGATSEVRTATITVKGVNDGPSAANDHLETLSGHQLSIAASTLLANDSDPDHGAILKLVAVDGARNGMVELKNGAVVFTPATGFVGTTTFEYVVADEFGATARGQVTVEVTPTDMVFIATQAPENFVGGSGTNTVSYQNSTCAVWADLSLGRGWTSYAYGDTYKNIQSLIGSRYGDMLVGDAQDNTLIGGGGGDVLSGGAGQDTVSYADSDGGVSVNVALHFGQRHDAQNDTLFDIEDVIGSSFDDVLTGDCGNNSLYGGAGNDTLDGGGGNDLLVGGGGNDTYMVGSSGDRVVEQEAVGGTDTVVSTISYALLSGLENLTLAGCSAINGTGNGLANVLIGNSAKNTLSGGAGDDTLDGGGGNDTLVGGVGNDIYMVESSGDMVLEQTGEGRDTVQASLSYALGNNVENLTLTGSANLTGTGNALDNLLLGNCGRNLLTGGAGNDSLDGGAGNDTLVGGSGNDVYAFGRGSGQDIVRENDATAGNSDTICFGPGIAMDQLWFAKSGSNLVISIIGSSDKVTVENWYRGGAYHVEHFETADGHVLADTQVSNLVNAMAGFSAPKAGQTVLPKSLENVLEPVIAANWH